MASSAGDFTNIILSDDEKGGVQIDPADEEYADHLRG